MGDETKIPLSGDEESKALKNHVDDASPGEASVTMDSFNDASFVKILNDKESSEATSREQDSGEFVCLKKDDLLKYASDPFWVRVRIVLMLLFGIAWISMLVAAIVIIVIAPKCPAQPTLEWWQKGVIYHIHPQSFMDAKREDGFGDIEGILEKVDYLKDTLQESAAICIGPMYPSSNFNYSYNVMNFNSTCPHHFGSLSDLKRLCVALHKKGLKILLDFIPNHTSRKHLWFVSSSQPDSKQHSVYKDFYIWHPGRVDTGTGSRLPPNNWLNVYGGSAWTFDPNRQEFYYHAFSEDEPDLNLRNGAVVNELDSSLRLWLSRGIDGFRMYGAQYLVESTHIDDNEPAVDSPTPVNGYGSIVHDHTTFQRESYELMEHWRQLLDDFSNNDGKARSQYYPRLLIAEVDGDTRGTASFMLEVVNGTRHERAHIATNKQLVKIDSNCKTECIYKLLTQWQRQSSADIWPNWQLGNVDSSRIGTRIQDRMFTNAFNMLLLTLPGTPIVYYGDELGMQDSAMNASLCAGKSTIENTCRLVNRAPMQWSDSNLAGFTSGNETWIPVNTNYHSVNVEAQLAHGAGTSPLTVFRELTGLRQKPSLMWGKLFVAARGNVLFYVRKAEGFDGFLVAINFGPDPSTVDLTSGYSDHVPSLPAVGKLVATTGHFEGPGRSNAFEVGTEVKLSSVYMKPGEGIVLQLPVE